MFQPREECSRTFFSGLEPSSLDQNILPSGWNILLWSQNILPLGWNILLWIRTFFLCSGTFFLLAGTFFLGVRTFFSGLEPSSSSSEHPTDFTCVWCWDILGFHLGTPTYPAARFFKARQGKSNTNFQFETSKLDFNP